LGSLAAKAIARSPATASGLRQEPGVRADLQTSWSISSEGCESNRWRSTREAAFYRWSPALSRLKEEILFARKGLRDARGTPRCAARSAGRKILTGPGSVSNVLLRLHESAVRAVDGPFRALSSTFCGKICAGTPKPATRGRQFNDSGYQEQGTGLALSQIEKQFGKGSIMKLGEQAIEPPGHCGDPLPNIVVEPLHPNPLLSEGHTRTLAVSHKQGYARVNAQVDEGIAGLVEALSGFPTLCTLNSCEGRAFVSFRFGNSASESAAFLCWLARQFAGDDNVSLHAEWGGGMTQVLTLYVRPSSIFVATRTVASAPTAFRRTLCSCGTVRKESRSCSTYLDRPTHQIEHNLPANLVERIAHDLRT
jgi:hypothetical protein